METITKIVDQYNISEIAPIEILRESGDNRVYVIGKNSKKILRLSKRLPIEDVQFEFEALQHLARSGFPVPGWVKTKNGNFYASAEEIEVAVIFDFLEGYHAQIDKDTLPTKEQAHTAGRALASMANMGKTFIPSSPRQRTIFTEVERVLKNEEKFVKDFEGGEAFVQQIKQAIAFARESKYSVGLIHNDYRVGNVFFKNDAELSGVIDFDWSCIGPNIKDFALGVLEWSYPDGRLEPDFAVFDAFLDGYNSISTEKINKGKELYTWILFAALSDTATFFCDRLSSPELKRKIASSYMYRKYLFFSKL